MRLVLEMPNKPKHLSDAGTRFIATFEGFGRRLYNDVAGHCTIGYGHLVHRGNCTGREPQRFRAGLSESEALDLLREDAALRVSVVRAAVTVALTQNQFDALVSFVFNVGETNFGTSTLLRKLNEGNYDSVPTELKRWVNAGGKPVQGLVRRRAEEADLFVRADKSQPDPDGVSAHDLGVVEALQRIGFPLPASPSKNQIHEAIADFQRGWAFWVLEIDGYVGQKTERALRSCLEQGGRCSQNFRYREFESKGADDVTIKVRRELIIGLETYRAEFGPVAIVSGYRDPEHNDDVGGAANSQHLYGNGADIARKATVAQVKALHCFSGIGYDQSDGLVRHVDVRHLGPNTTGGSVASPTIWVYA
jgi:GH24 family phage-related lysozyme (muramidase)